jgi:uncharacterized protein
MKTEPRRSERAMKTREEMERLLERMPAGCLAVTTEDGPYVVAMNYLFHEGKIYLHSAQAGRKIDALANDSRVCFLVYEDGPQVAWDKGCGISQIYRSVICFGKAELIENANEKKMVLEKMIEKYGPPDMSIPPMDDQNIGRTAVIKIVIESMSGKANELTSEHTVIRRRSTDSE